ncbi:MAG: PAC2 family protein, partial [Hadesarchaea archaeon]|nr:PAC2 family protein [Hadesarchaea archaeon]
YKLSSEILDVAAQHGVDTVITMAAYVLSPNESRSKVVGTATDVETAKLLNEHGVELLDGGTIVGMNGLLPALAGIRGLKGFCLLGVTGGGIVDVGGAVAVLEALSGILGFRLDLTNIYKYAMAPPKFKPLKLEFPIGSEEEISYIR